MPVTINGTTGETTPATVYSGSSSGSITVQAPAVAGTNTLTLPAATGTIIYGTQPSGAIVGTTDTQTLTNKTLTSPTITGAAMSSMASSVITASTAQATTSGTSITFGSIPSWVKRITVILNGVSSNGSSMFLLRIGSGSVTSSGYASQCSIVYSSVGMVTQTTGFALYSDNPAYTSSGNVILTNVSGNTWIASGSGLNSTSIPFCWFMGGNVTLSGTLDRVVLTTVNGTDTFDAGSINIFYE